MENNRLYKIRHYMGSINDLIKYFEIDRKITTNKKIEKKENQK